MKKLIFFALMAAIGQGLWADQGISEDSEATCQEVVAEDELQLRWKSGFEALCKGSFEQLQMERAPVCVWVETVAHLERLAIIEENNLESDGTSEGLSLITASWGELFGDHPLPTTDENWQPPVAAAQTEVKTPNYVPGFLEIHMGQVNVCAGELCFIGRIPPTNLTDEGRKERFLEIQNYWGARSREALLEASLWFNSAQRRMRDLSPDDIVRVYLLHKQFVRPEGEQQLIYSFNEPDPTALIDTLLGCVGENYAGHEKEEAFEVDIEEPNEVLEGVPSQVV